MSDSKIYQLVDADGTPMGLAAVSLTDEGPVLDEVQWEGEGDAYSRSMALVALMHDLGGAR